MKKKMIPITALALSFALTVPVMASGLNVEIGSNAMNEKMLKSAQEGSDLGNDVTAQSPTYLDVFDSMKMQLMNNGTVSLNDTLKGFAIKTPELNAASLYDLSEIVFSADIDYGITNQAYESMASNLGSSFMQYASSDLSIGCMNLFDSTYSGVKDQLSLPNPSIPSGFSVDSMISNAKASVNSSYSDIIGSDLFSNTKDSISIGSVFEAANNGLDKPEVKSHDEIANSLDTTMLDKKDEKYRQKNDENKQKHDDSKEKYYDRTNDMKDHPVGETAVEAADAVTETATSVLDSINEAVTAAQMK